VLVSAPELDPRSGAWPAAQTSQPIDPPLSEPMTVTTTSMSLAGRRRVHGVLTEHPEMSPMSELVRSYWSSVMSSEISETQPADDVTDSLIYPPFLNSVGSRRVRALRSHPGTAR
jgi:hypothetical protein